jgi:two-component system, sensor histidine kinase
VINLVSNALRFTPVGGTIEVVVGADGGDAVLRVRDSGVGIAPEMLRRVFEPFVQAERGPDRGPGGLGLGLTLVRRIAELHGGRVDASSDGPDRGSAFAVRLPALPAPSSDHVVTPGGPVSDGARRRILVVEDNEDARAMLRLVLSLAGQEVHDAADGPAGLEAALRLRPDVALIDVGLPGFDGHELARRLRATLGPTIHLVALTGYGQPEDRRRAQEAGFDAHLVKPVDPDALLATIHFATGAPQRA